MVNCEVKFDNNPQGIYYSGQVLSGLIELNNEKARKIKGVTLRIEGFAKCKWHEHEGAGKSRRQVTYRGREDYINTFSYLVSNHDVTNTELSAGLHKYNFSCQLPPQLPTSFESKYGYIRYQVKVEMERPWKSDIKFCFAFTVIKVLDLNFESPGLRNPLKVEKTKAFFLGLSGKSLIVSAQIPISGFLAGQTVPVSISINNESKVDVEEMKITLKKYIFYNSQTPRRKTKERLESVAEVRNAGVSAKNKGNVEVHLVLPATPPTNKAFCSVLQVTYEIHVLAKVSGMHRSLLLRIPITIGTIPLHNYHQQFAPSVMLSNWSNQPGPSNAFPSVPYPQNNATAPDSPYSQNMPPPSYHQAMGMNEADDDNDEALTEDKPFSPMYPVFNFAATPSGQQGQQFQPSNPPPSYGFAAAPYFGEKKDF